MSIKAIDNHLHQVSYLLCIAYYYLLYYFSKFKIYPSIKFFFSFSMCFLGKCKVNIYIFLIIQYTFTWLHQAYYKWYCQENTVSILKQMETLHLRCDQNISFMCHWGKFEEYFICNQNVTITSMKLR